MSRPPRGVGAGQNPRQHRPETMQPPVTGQMHPATPGPFATPAHLLFNKLPAAASNQSSSAKRIQKELEDILRDPPVGCYAGPKGDSLFEWIATMEGPTSTPYETGIFFLDIRFPPDYPFEPPKIYFRTRIYHCNVSEDGLLSLNSLLDGWSPASTIHKVLILLRKAMKNPCLEEAVMKSIAQQFIVDRAAHDKLARDWTKRFAT